MSKMSDSGIQEQQRAHETREVTIKITLPHDIADQAEEIQRTDPEFLSRVVLYGLTRRSIYQGIRDRSVDPIGLEEGRRILAENRHHDGGAWADKAGEGAP